MNLKGLSLHHYCGLETDEPLAPRTLIWGPNTSGKTARLRAIRFALVGAAGRDGLLPYASGGTPTVVLSLAPTTDAERPIVITRGAIADRGFETFARTIPDGGEKTINAVNARIQRVVRPNVLALDLEKWMGDAVAARRRELLGLLSVSIPATTVMGKLDAELAGNRSWKTLRDRLPAVDDGLILLAHIEGLAKADASEARMRKTNARAMLRESGGETSVPVGIPEEELRATREKTLAEIRDIVAQRAKGEQRAKAIAGHRDQIAKLERWLSVNAKTFGEPLNLAGWKPEDWARFIAELRAAQSKSATTYADALKEMERLLDESRKETAAADVKRGKGAAILAVFGIVHESSKEPPRIPPFEVCPVCGSSPQSQADGGDTEVDRANERVRAFWLAAGQHDHAAEELRGEAERTRADTLRHGDEEANIRRQIEIAEGARDRGAMIDQARKSIHDLEGEADAPVDEENEKQLRTLLDQTEERLIAIARERGRTESRRKAATLADEAEAAEKDAKDVQALAGPSGLSGAYLADAKDRFTAPMTAVFARVFKGWTVGLDVFDVRGNPDASVSARDPDGKRVPWEGLSGAQQATAIAALAAAIAAATEGTSICLVEGGCMDPRNLAAFLDGIEGTSIGNIVVATHIVDAELIEAAQSDGWLVLETATR